VHSDDGTGTIGFVHALEYNAGWRRGTLRIMRKPLILAAVLALCALASAWFLVLNRPEKSDVIVVLAGESDARPARGLELLNQGYAPRMILDAPPARIYQWSETELAERYLQSLPQAHQITVCPIHGLSTRDEAADVEGCLRGLGVRRVLLVTSDFHTRRALSVFRNRAPLYEYSVAAAFDSREFGVKWWRRREWAKVNFDEWVRLLWWEVVERWQ
jgi:uncharacterized SAM-binding protein YcdF (DUF218 family)